MSLEEVLYDVTFYASLATIAVAGIILWQTLLTGRTTFSTLLSKLGEEHTKILQQELTLERNTLKQTLDACEIHALSYCDFLDRVAYLAKKRKIPSKVALKFKSYFEYVYVMMDWYNINIVKEPGQRILRLSEQRWPSIHEWCRENRIKRDYDPRFLPEIMQNIWVEQDKDSYNAALEEAERQKNSSPSDREYD